MPITFQDYNSKPIVRKAYEIKEADLVEYDAITKTGVLKHTDESLTFVAYEEPVAGDYIIYLKADDIYHCSAAVFKERNIIPDFKFDEECLSCGS